jgi:probable addiction module antidote protein
MDIAAYIEAMWADGDTRAIPIALRTVADALGGMAALAEKTGLSRETLYRTLSEKGNPRLDTLSAILGAFGLRLSVQPTKPPSARRGGLKPAHA